jgi:hypothetical protein
VPTAQGALSVKWAQAVADRTFHLEVVPPAGTSGEVWVPLASAASASRALTPGATWLRRSGTYDVYHVAAGTFEFSSAPASYASLSQLVTSYALQGKVTVLGALQLQLRLVLAALLEHLGLKQQAVQQLEAFRSLADDPRLVRDPAARDALVREDDVLIAVLRNSG